MTPDEMKKRAKEYGLRIVRLVESLPNSRTANVIAGQLLRCGMSVGANYRAACRGRSHPDFAAKMGIVEEEADESIYWIEMLVDCGMVKDSLVQPLLAEGNEILSIVVSSIRTARSNGARSKTKSAIRNQQSAIRGA
jgi:four helix bundle protein